MNHRIQPPDEQKGAIIGRCFVCGQHDASRGAECIAPTPSSPHDVVLRETWWHPEHTSAIAVGNSSNDLVAQFRELGETKEGIARRHRAHVAAAAPELARAVLLLLNQGDASPEQRDVILDLARRALRKAGVE